MISQEENELLTRTGRGTPCGDLMRRYWQPVALTDELPPSSAPLPVRILGEDLVVFRDDRGKVGLLGLHCSHRGADLSYARIEDGGLRCIYHGWLYDTDGNCLEQPGEPAGSTFHEKVHHLAYPCQEKAGIIFAYLGPDEAPLLPNYEFLNAPEESRFVTKYIVDCNYLQANEGNLDQTHLSFLHRSLSGGRGETPDILAEDTSPILDPEETDFGVRLYAVRRFAGLNHVKISNFLVPNASAFSGGVRNGYCVHIHVPIDDERHWKYVLHFSRSGPLDERSARQFQKEVLPNHTLRRNMANRYEQDREEMKLETFSGIGMFFHAQDSCVTEGAGPVQDPTVEHLGYTDRALLASRKSLLRAIRDVQEGHDPQNVIRDPSANSFPDLVARSDEIPGDMDWKEHWKGRDTDPQPARRRG